MTVVKFEVKHDFADCSVFRAVVDEDNDVYLDTSGYQEVWLERDDIIALAKAVGVTAEELE